MPELQNDNDRAEDCIEMKQREYDLKEMLAENARRQKRFTEPYDAETGVGCVGERVERYVRCRRGRAMLPAAMVADKRWKGTLTRAQYMALRFNYDFEFWALHCVKIRHKVTGEMVALRLNRAQRKLLALMEEERTACRPIRVILLKARQWGGSTLVQMYFAWIQCVLRREWHSLICAHVKNTSSTIRGMYSNMLRLYPDEWWDGDTSSRGFRAFEGSAITRRIEGRGCNVTIASSFGPETMRGLDYSLAHLSEVAFWKASETTSPEEAVGAICGGVALVKDSAVVIESTANGLGNFFHREWVRAKSGASLFKPLFVGWHDIELYRYEVDDPERVIRRMDDYEWHLWDNGCSIEQIEWYHFKRRESSSHRKLMTEYPTDDVEAFATTDNGVFSPHRIEELRRGCREAPERGRLSTDGMTGPCALENLRFEKNEAGGLEVWRRPVRGNPVDSRYVVAVDVGGRTDKSDWSVIAVLDRLAKPKAEIVAQWRGHCDHDILGWRAAAIARWYDNAKLAIESNTLETAYAGTSRYILEELNGAYDNLYVRECRDDLMPGVQHRLGFHTNVATKQIAVSALIAYVRDMLYTERSSMACDELATFEQQKNGRYGAKAGYHDDIVMTRAIALYVAVGLNQADYCDAADIEYLKSQCRRNRLATLLLNY